MHDWFKTGIKLYLISDVWWASSRSFEGVGGGGGGALIFGWWDLIMLINGLEEKGVKMWGS